MRFAFLSQAWPISAEIPFTGSSVQVYNVSKELSKRGYDSLVILSAHPAFQKIIDDRLTVVSCKTIMGMLNPLWLHRIDKLLEEFKPDIIYQRGKLPETIVAAYYAWKVGAKFIWLSNADNSGEKWKFLRIRIKEKRNIISKLILLLEALCADFFIHNAIKRADLVIAQTQKQQRSLKQNFNLDSVILGSGYEIPPIAPKKNTKPQILWLANLTPMKQPHLFAELAVALKDENVEFIMAGKAPDKNILHQVLKITANISNFRYLGGINLQEGNEIFKNATLFISTSWENYEGLPNTFIQAFMHAVPIISLNSDPDQMIQNEKMGAVCNSFIDLIKTTKMWIRNKELQDNASKNAYLYANNNFKVEQLVDRLLDEIKTHHK
ncbi:MAG: glycosyltransferase family 4 protein [Candidatus Pacebacteria bacterium]|nr:glycosyltransferase family 4 protein [Candidatus Paceibacterota bacterium]